MHPHLRSSCLLTALWAALRIGVVRRPLVATYGPAEVRRWGQMPRKEPGDWLTVAVRIVLDWRFLIAVAVVLRILLNR